MKKVYLDNAATTAVDQKVMAAMQPFFDEKYGNASEPHAWGQEARKAIDQARSQVAKFLNCKSGEIIFTSGATESINLAHKGLIEAVRKQSKVKTPHIITSSIEHKAVLESCQHLEKLGLAEVTYLSIGEFGLVRLEDIKKAIRPETVLVSVMYVNNEVGTIQSIKEIGAFLKKKPKIFFHTDATQAIQYLDCRVDKLNVDFLSLTGHKFYAPKGIGALYVRKGAPLAKQQDGGGQEYRLRAGTENVPYIVALGRAIERSSRFKVQGSKKIEKLRNRLIEGVLKIPGTTLTGHPKSRAPHVASFVVEKVEGEAMLLYLSEKGVAASSGSACTSGLLKPSHVLTAMGIPAQLAHGSLRFSLGQGNTAEEVDYVLKVLPEIVKRLREMAPKLG